MANATVTPHYRVHHDPKSSHQQISRLVRERQLAPVLDVGWVMVMGKFPKMERGPLDKTHLQFFTRDTAKEMVEAAGLKVIRTTTTGVPLDEVWKKGEGSAMYKVFSRCQHLLLKIAPRVFGFQW